MSRTNLSEEGFAALSLEEQRSWWAAYWEARPTWVHERVSGIQDGRLRTAGLTRDERQAGGLPPEPEPAGAQPDDPATETAMANQRAAEEFEKRKAKVLEAALANPTFSQAQIGAMIALPQEAVSRCFIRLRAEGQLPPLDPSEVQKRRKPKSTSPAVEANTKAMTKFKAQGAPVRVAAKPARPKPAQEPQPMNEALTKLYARVATIEGELAGLRSAIQILERFV